MGPEDLAGFHARIKDGSPGVPPDLLSTMDGRYGFAGNLELTSNRRATIIEVVFDTPIESLGFMFPVLSLKRPERGRVWFTNTAPALASPSSNRPFCWITPERFSYFSSTLLIYCGCSKGRYPACRTICSVFFGFSSHLKVCCCKTLARWLTPTLALIPVVCT